MQKSRRARRMERHHKLRRTPSINLVSLMDIFTILVFFLLVNSSSHDDLANNKDLKLPSSTSDLVPQQTLVISVTSSHILVEGVSVATVEQAVANDESVIDGLRDELEFRKAARGGAALSVDAANGLPVTIVGHENISYGLIRKILLTCQQSEYTRIAFATNQRTERKPTTL